MKFASARRQTARARITASVAVAVGCVLAAAGCTAAKPSPAATSTATGNTPLTISAAASGPFTDSYNPLIASSASSSGYSAYAIFEPLLQEDFGNGKTRPWLVSSYTWAPDGKSLTLKLRKGVKWSDGTPFTAEDVAFTFGLLQKFPALNATALPLSSETATNSNTVVLKFSQPASQLMWWRVETVPEHLWKDVGDPVTYANAKPVGTGPYALKTFSPQTVTLTRNLHYWQSGLPRFKTVQYIASDSGSSQVTSLSSGAIDWVGTTGVDGPSIQKLSPNNIGYWQTKVNPAVIVLVPNLTKAPLNDLAVRQAMNAALDRSKISTVGTSGHNAPVVSPTGLDLATRGTLIASKYKSMKYQAANASKAKKILTDAGYKMQNGVFVSPKGEALDFTLTVPTAYPQGDLVGMTRVIVPELAAAGIHVTVKSEQQVSYQSDVELGHYDLTLRSNGGTPSVYDFYNRIFNQQALNAAAGTRTQLNYERYSNPDVTQMLATYAGTVPGSKPELAAVSGFEKLMVNDLPVLPLTFTAGIGLWRTDVAAGWPDAKNPYATPVPGNVNAELVLLGITPKK